MCLYQTPGRRPPPITGRFLNTVTRGWVGAPNGLAPFRFHGAVVGFGDRCLSRTRNLAASNEHLAEFFSGRSWPKIGPGMIFFERSCSSKKHSYVAHSKSQIITWNPNERLSYCSKIEKIPIPIPILNWCLSRASPRFD